MHLTDLTFPGPQCGAGELPFVVGQWDDANERVIPRFPRPRRSPESAGVTV
ncbi:hypothetical protein PV341_38080 [Streptomyces sp. PA03-1a]|nr:hypothetical protein [Streptomyces sp. PA03-1a]MDX2813372.1 hypothetical protein [Streptomyces sp. PA03-5A]